MTIVKKVSSGSPWEDIVGYSRGIRVGDQFEIAGTTATGENGEIAGLNDPYEQTRYIIQKAEKAIRELGGRLEHVTRTRMFVVNIQDWEAVGKAHGEFFSAIKPVATMVEVSKLIDDGLLVEIEFSGIIT
ncbi:MAG: RidA family protein [Bacteroidales bacterium]